MKAIETVYAGCRFRSRLEARWAVFFDTLGIKWEYEPQGFVIGISKRRYLPDFFLPDHNAWVEVKGDIDKIDFGLMLDAVDYGMGLPDVSDGAGGLLLLGPVPRPHKTFQPSFPFLTHHKGVTAGVWTFSKGPDGDLGFGFSATGGDESLPNEFRRLLEGKAARVVPPAPDARVNRALAAARSARFEHDARETW